MIRRRFAVIPGAFLLVLCVPNGWTQRIQLPTANHALYERGGFERFFVGTVGKSWLSGAFGCVRTEGRQFHEGLDIRCLERDKRGEPTDPVMAAADGDVVYINANPSLSNYGRYIVLQHEIDGLKLFSLYAHLREIQSDLREGAKVQRGERIGTLGRSANTRAGISKEQAHVHFELAFVANDRFPQWSKHRFPGRRNDHGMWNGQNLIGIDPARLLLEQRETGDQFSLIGFVRTQPELFRVAVRTSECYWTRHYSALIRTNPKLQKEGVAGYEVSFSYSGVPINWVPRTAAELASEDKIDLISVNPEEAKRHGCRGLVRQRGGRWELTTRARDLVELLIY